MLVSLETTTGAVLVNGTPATALTLRKGNVMPFRVQFLRDGVPFEPPSSVALSVRVNAADTYGGTGYATGTLEAVEGTGEEAVCVAKLDLSGQPLANAFSGGAPSVAAQLEIRWSLGGYTLTSDIVPATITQTLH